MIAGKTDGGRVSPGPRGAPRAHRPLAAASQDLEALYKDRADDPARSHQLAMLRYAQGDIAGASNCSRSRSTNRRRKGLVRRPAREFHVALAARYTNNIQLSNDAYREALRKGPQMTDAGVSWADLFLQKYHAQLAEQTLEEVFKVNPNHPDAHAAMAEVILETRYELSAVRHHLDKALGVNPKNGRALKARASIEIDQNQWDGAIKSLDAVLAVNKDDVEAIAMKATIYWLRDDVKAY